MKTLYAEIQTGVHVRGDDSFVTEIVKDEKVFYAALKDLADGEYIRCDTISDAMEEKIAAEYGIKR